MLFRILPLLVPLLLAAPVLAQVPEVETKIDPAKAKAEFAEASRTMKELIAELTVLQADYHRPGGDKKGIEAKFNATKEKAQATSERLETSAFALAMVEPKNEAAREITDRKSTRLNSSHSSVSRMPSSA